ncbi:hypothetical protein L810_2641 [Burkholderia sp. AU4i]|nr:hypothetical protein L810_2641 [Burkholderia sp. AU4i]
MLLHRGFLSFVCHAAECAAEPCSPDAAPDWCVRRTLRP